jgi:hypothetical protein
MAAAAKKSLFKKAFLAAQQKGPFAAFPPYPKKKGIF